MKAAAGGYVVTMAPVRFTFVSRSQAIGRTINMEFLSRKASTPMLCSGAPPTLTKEGDMETPEECLREAEECERLAGLARSIATRQIMTVAAFKWRQLAEKVAERRKPSSSFVWPQRHPF